MIWPKNRDKDKPKDASLKPGTLFEKYSVVKELGRGGMGAVYLVRHTVLDSPFALKILAPDIAKKNKQFVDRFIREAKLACKIKHPNLIAVHDAGQNPQNGLYYIIMDYVPGGSVRDLLKKTHRIPPGRALEIITQVAGALSAAKAHHMVHRDIKPDNIMFTADGAAKLADLGIAKSTDEQDTMLTMASSVFGTPAYMSPEQAKDSSKVDSRADIYSLGIVFYEMLSGKRPFSGDTTIQILSQVMDPESTPDIRKICPETPQDLADLIARMTEKNLEKRIPDPDTLVRELKKIRLPDHIASRPLRTRGEILVDKQTGTVPANGAPAGEVTMPTLATAAPADEATMPTMATAAPAGEVTMPTMATAAPQASATEDTPEVTMPTMATAAPPVSMAANEPQVSEPEPQTVESANEPEPVNEPEPANEPTPESQALESAPQTVASAPQTVASAPQTVASAEPEPQPPAAEDSPEATMPTMAPAAPPAPAPVSAPEATISAPPSKSDIRQTAPQITSPSAKTAAPPASHQSDASASPKKSKKGIVIVLASAACLVFVLGAVVVGMFLIGGSKSPEPPSAPANPASVVTDARNSDPATAIRTAETKPVSGGQTQDVRPEQNTVAAANKPAANTEVTPAATTVATAVRTGSETPSNSGEDEDEMLPDPLRKGQIVLLSDTSTLARNAKKALTKEFGAEKVSFQEAAGMGSYKRELDKIAKASPSAVVICFALQYAEDGISASGYENVIGYHADLFREKGIPFLFLQSDEDEDDDRMQPFLNATRDLCQYRSIPLVAADGPANGKLVSAVRGLLPGGTEN